MSPASDTCAFFCHFTYFLLLVCVDFICGNVSDIQNIHTSTIIRNLFISLLLLNIEFNFDIYIHKLTVNSFIFHSPLLYIALYPNCYWSEWDDNCLSVTWIARTKWRNDKIMLFWWSKRMCVNYYWMIGREQCNRIEMSKWSNEIYNSSLILGWRIGSESEGITFFVSNESRWDFRY